MKLIAVTKTGFTADKNYSILMEATYEEVRTLIAQIEDQAMAIGFDFRQFITTPVARTVTKEINPRTMRSTYGVKMYAGATITVTYTGSDTEPEDIAEYIAGEVLTLIA